MLTIEFEENNLIILMNGQRKMVDLRKLSPKLLAASGVERNLYQISSSGYGIHWPLIDEDLSVRGLIQKENKPK